MQVAEASRHGEQAPRHHHRATTCACGALRQRNACVRAGVGMVQVGDELPRSGEPAARYFRCQAGCLESSLDGKRCQPPGTLRFVVKMPADWRGLPGRDGVPSCGPAEFCGSCWASGLWPRTLLDDYCAPAHHAAPARAPVAAARARKTSAVFSSPPTPAKYTQKTTPPVRPARTAVPAAVDGTSLEATTAAQKIVALRIVRNFMFDSPASGRMVASRLRGAPSYAPNGMALRMEARAFRNLHPTAPQIALPRPADRLSGMGPITRADAMEIFMADFEIICITPELTHFEELARDPRWCVPGFVDQIRMPCAVCGTNEFVTLSRSNVVKGDIKFFHDFTGPRAIVCSRYSCANPACGSVRKSANGTRIIPAGFSASAPQQLDMLPDSVRLDFDFVLLPSGRGGYTNSLKNFVLKSCAKQLQDTTTVAEQYQHRRDTRLHRYILWAAVQQSGGQQQQQSTLASSAIGIVIGPPILPNITGPFPTPSRIPSGTPFSPPSADFIEAYTADIFHHIKDHIDGDLMRRDPGEIMSSDATFSLAAITISTGQMMVFLMGENADVIRWFVTRTESFTELRLGLYRLRGCLHSADKLSKLKYWYTDTRCEKCKPERLTEHIICKLFPIKHAICTSN